MEIITAKSAGFCFGVNRAIEACYNEIEKGGRIVTYGPLIHNKNVNKDLENKGVKSVDTLDGCEGATVIIRSHGVLLNRVPLGVQIHLPIIGHIHLPAPERELIIDNGKGRLPGLRTIEDKGVIILSVQALDNGISSCPQDLGIGIQHGEVCAIESGQGGILP